jgi:hypothetical protein
MVANIFAVERLAPLPVKSITEKHAYVARLTEKIPKVRSKLPVIANLK